MNGGLVSAVDGSREFYPSTDVVHDNSEQNVDDGGQTLGREEVMLDQVSFPKF
jgi:hypothetical protein